MAFLWDARHEPRTTVETRVTIEVDHFTLRGWSVDLTERGIGIHCPATLYSDQKITIAFSGGNDSHYIRVQAVVRHSNGFRHGCEFVTVTAADREAIRNLIAHAKQGAVMQKMTSGAQS
jgi:hypothetical protein